MGYYTRYSITAYNYKDGQKEKIVEIDDTRHSFDEDEQVFVDEIQSIVGYLPTDDSCKWYSHEQDMLTLSLKHSTALFKVHGEGEDPDDIWDKWFLNGKMQICNAEIVIPDFNPSKLQ